MGLQRHMAKVNENNPTDVGLITKSVELHNCQGARQWVLLLYSDYRKETDSDVYGIYPNFEDALAIADELSCRGQQDEDGNVITTDFIDRDSIYVLPPPNCAFNKRLGLSHSSDDYKRLQERNSSWVCYLRVAIIPAPVFERKKQS